MASGKPKVAAAAIELTGYTSVRVFGRTDIRCIGAGSAGIDGMINRWDWCFACLVAVGSTGAAQDAKSDTARVEQADRLCRAVRWLARGTVAGRK